MQSRQTKKLGIFTATSLVISSMVGTGVFTSLGYQVVDIQSGFSIVFLWVVGGVIAFCGAVSYAELGAVYKRSGGEYHLLRELYHPALGFVAGWVSITVGFAAPAAIAALALASYLSALFPGLPQAHIAALVVLSLSFIHGYSMNVGNWLQDLTTLFKIGLIIVFVLFGLGIEAPQQVDLTPTVHSWQEIGSSAFAVSLVYVLYAYTGWNASIYILDDMDNAPIILPRSLFAGTLIVLVLYVMLNYVFLHTVPLAELQGQIEVAYLSGLHIFGDFGGLIINLAISFLLVSTVSAYVFVGPRVSAIMGEDIRALQILSRKNTKGIPVNAFVFSAVLSLFFIYSSTFEQVLVYTSFLLILITTLTVAGVFIVRYRKVANASGYQTWGYPYTPALFILVNLWTLVYVALDKPFESLISMGILAVGLFIYWVTDHNVRKS